MDRLVKFVCGNMAPDDGIDAPPVKGDTVYLVVEGTKTKLGVVSAISDSQAEIVCRSDKGVDLSTVVVPVLELQRDGMARMTFDLDK